MNKSLKNVKQGFTLVELLIVIIIIAVLAGIVLIALNPAEQRSRAILTTIKSNVAAVCRAQALCMVENDATACTGATAAAAFAALNIPVPNDGATYTVANTDPYGINAEIVTNGQTFDFDCNNIDANKGQVICNDNSSTDTTYNCLNFNL